MPFSCSRCDRPNIGGSVRAAGACSSCPDGAALCDKCFDGHVGGLAKFQGHAFARSTAVAPGVALLERLHLAPAPRACMRHDGQPFTGLACAECDAGAPITNLCQECIKVHARVHPRHLLAHVSPDVPALRALLVETAHQRVDGCYANAAPSNAAAATRGPSCASAAGSESTTASSEELLSDEASPPPPLLACAQHKVIAAGCELDALDGYEDDALAQLSDNRAAAFAAVQAHYEALVASVRAAAAAKRMALEAALATAEEAFEAALTMTVELTEVRASAAPAPLWGSP